MALIALKNSLVGFPVSGFFCAPGCHRDFIHHIECAGIEPATRKGFS